LAPAPRGATPKSRSGGPPRVGNVLAPHEDVRLRLTTRAVAQEDSMGERTSLLIVVLAFVAAGCGGGSPAGPSSTSAPEAASQTAAEQPAAASDEPGCTFSLGVTTCVTTTQSIVTSTHTEVSGCMAFNGTTFVAGRRERTFEDRVQVTQT